ncbi:RdgB/HAM1 family non-canonical purine NTP pyrophosphatase [Candidatus Woesearchaeota archaeon]|jgi:inosine triphosphate pyrophosphatase|nr:RdgB/HAM1 family non-canonical purine NTP pyrophosphatase [Candidatus Woesearchaeota archaeon]MBT6520449.1 RdgB/HAM1 family non-canonical purine NTP pyrophosphatase [Candidatus Woesearchaeota archaeon]MBT7367343.1 RdgB/HAM1 family non-canonical purine NTP pyrophosphatase [Candidatus Woesearchaeota archaeon]
MKKQKTKKQKTILFITGNMNKLREAREILTDFNVMNKKIDLPELQGEPVEIVEEKTKVALKLLKKPVIVEDTNLRFNALNGLPGPYIKDFLHKLGMNGLWELLSGKKDKNAYAAALIGYGEPGGKVKVFEGKVLGTIVKPCGDSHFGWDPIFKPKGSKKTFAQMSAEEKNKISHRKKAFIKLKKYLDNK